MKKIFSILGAGFLSAIAFTSCDNVAEPDRFVPVETINAKRVVLIEEFTGQRCTNCPDGHEAIHNILAAYPESVVAVSINASSLAIPESQGGLMTETGDEYYKAVGSPALPTAVINKNTSPLMVDNWASSVVSIMAKETPLELKVDASLDNAGENIAITVNLDCMQDLYGKLQVWVTEDDIVGYQLDHGANDFQYVHNHVFRAAVNGTWGQEVDLKAYTPVSLNFNIAVNEKWNSEHLHIVAFVYNDADGVVQAGQAQVVK